MVVVATLSQEFELTEPPLDNVVEAVPRLGELEGQVARHWVLGHHPTHHSQQTQP